MTILVRDDELWSLLESDENDKLDFKSADLLTEPDGENRYKIAKHITGFANHRGGKIIFGVNDEGEPEAADLIEEACLSTISEVVSEMCSPTVDFSHEFYSERRGDLSEGTVLVLNISRKTTPPPVAIVENSEGKIRKREYRIRSGESTRLVSDGELLALFSKEHELEIEGSSKIWYTHSDNLRPTGMAPRPFYFSQIDNIYDQMAEEPADIFYYITDNESQDTFYAPLFTKVMCCVVVSQLYRMSESQFMEAIELEGESNQTAYEFVKHHPNDIDIEDNKSDDLMERLPTDPISYASGMLEGMEDFLEDEDVGLIAPKNSQVQILDDYGKIVISVGDEFDIEIRLDWKSSSTDYPPGHPMSGENNIYAIRRGIIPQHEPDIPPEESNVQSHEIEISIKGEFSYPSQSQEQYVVSKAFTQYIIDNLESTFDWRGFKSHIPDKEIVDIMDKLDEIDEKLSEE